MFRSAAAGLLVVPALALASSAAAAPSVTVKAHVDSSGAHGEKISLTEHGDDAGHLKLKPCVNTSATTFVCTGRGTILGVGPAKVRIAWHCPEGRPCVGHAEGTFTNHGSTLALLHVKGTPVKVESEGATFKIGVEAVGE